MAQPSPEESIKAGARLGPQSLQCLCKRGEIDGETEHEWDGTYASSADGVLLGTWAEKGLIWICEMGLGDGCEVPETPACMLAPRGSADD